MLATGFGSGLSPYMPGTMGSIIGVIIAYGMVQLDVVSMWMCYGLLCILSYFAAADRGRLLNDDDHKSIVCDEIVGILPALLLFDFGWSWLAAFVAFRFFDILKPWPISYIDQCIKGAWGCLLDDVIAGLLTVLLLVLFS